MGAFSIRLDPVLRDLRAIYDRVDRQERFEAYLDLMLRQRGEKLPLEEFSPMGRVQAGFLDQLIAIHAEDHVARFLLGLELSTTTPIRVMLVVVDEAKNGWTQRHLSDAEHRFGDLHRIPAKSFSTRLEPPSFVWVPVHLWTREFSGKAVIPSLPWVEQEVERVLRRTQWKMAQGRPNTLGDMIRQEAFCLERASPSSELSPSDLSRVTSQLSSASFPVQFAALYGDEAAQIVGYSPLGLETPVLKDVHAYQDGLQLL